MALFTIKGCDGKNAKGERMIAARHDCSYTGSSYGVYIYRENYKAGRMVGKWLVVIKGERDEVIEYFKKHNKAI